MGTRYQVYQEVIDKGLESAVKAERFPGLDLYSLRGTSEFHPGFVAAKHDGQNIQIPVGCRDPSQASCQQNNPNPTPRRI